jgi:hypothetical protein
MSQCRICKCTILCLALVVINANAVLAAGTIQSGFFDFPQVPPPLSVTWQLATVSGESVSATWSGIQPSPTNQLSITPENASAFGVDFDAWSQAVIDPAFTQSTVTANGVSQFGPVLTFGDVRRLDVIFFNVSQFRWPVQPGLPNFTVSVAAGEFEIVPEPPTSLLMTCSLAILLFAHRWFRLSRRLPCSITALPNLSLR